MISSLKLPQNEVEYYLIMNGGVSLIKLSYVGRNASRDVESFFAIKQENEHSYHRLNIDLTWEVLNEPLHSFDRRLPRRTFDPYEILLLAGRAYRFAEEIKSSEKGFVVHTGNVLSLFDFEDDLSKVDAKIKDLLFTFYKALPDEALTVEDIFVSTNYPLQAIISRMAYFKKRRIIKPFYSENMTSDEMEKPLKSPQWDRIKLFNLWDKEAGYLVTDEGIETLERLTYNRIEVSKDDKIDYFKIVDIPKIRDKKFSFVIMPFRENEINQAIFTELIKPIFEEKSGFMCIRSDDIRSPGPIDDRIYTCIEQCKFVVAELSKPNRNVFTELGMAIRANKVIYMLSKKKLKGLFFDTSHLWQIIYSDAEDLKIQLSQLEIHLK